MCRSYWVEKWDSSCKVWRPAEYCGSYWVGVDSVERAKSAAKYLKGQNPFEVYRVVEHDARVGNKEKGVVEQWKVRLHGWVFVWEGEGEEAIEGLREIEKTCPDLSFRLVRVIDLD